MVMDEMQLQQTQTDNCLFATQFAVAQLACCCSVLACASGSDEIRVLANCLTCAADIGFCLLCGCLQAQAYDALEARDREIPRTVLMPPEVQKMSAAAAKGERPVPGDGGA
jgi:hypothetical protein